jgi:uncharacterized protein (DUF3084 family)
MNLSFALQTILILIVISAAIAYIGNYVGRYFGKRRLSLFGLRPRYTALIFTLVSGILITLITFIIVISLSSDARTAIFGLESLRAKIRSAQRELSGTRRELSFRAAELKLVQEKFKKEIASLTGVKEKLKQEIEIMGSKRVLFMAGEDIYILMLQGGRGAKAAEGDLKKILDQLDKDLKKYKIEEVQVDRSDFESTLSYVANYNDELLVRLVSLKNITVAGVAQVKFEVQPNKLIFKKGEEIAKTQISSKLSQADIENKLKELLTQAHFISQGKGVIPDVSGSLGAVPYTEIYDTAKRIKGSAALVEVKVVAVEDIKSIGPLKIEFEVNR